MSHQLWLLRHAKSSWDDAHLPDHERPLAPRGRRAVVALRNHLTEIADREPGAPGPDHLGLPDLVLCSTARRAVETWEGIAPAFPSKTEVELSGALYGASATGLLHRLRQLPATAGSVLLVGHNPGFEDLARRLTGAGAPELRAELDAKFPTGALATLLVPEPWIGLRWGAAELVDYVVPRDLPG